MISPNLGAFYDISVISLASICTKTDFGFTNPDAISGLTTVHLKTDEMLAVLPIEHPLSRNDKVTLEELSYEPFILLDEGQLSEPLEYFKKSNLYPNVKFKVHDDYTIMSMIESGLGIAILPKLIVGRRHYNIVLKEVSPQIFQNIALVYKEKSILPIASRYFIESSTPPPKIQ